MHVQENEAGFSVTRLVWYMIRYVQCLVRRSIACSSDTTDEIPS